MKTLLLATLFFSQATHALNLKCDVERDDYSVVMDVSFEEMKINKMTYFKAGNAYKEFSGLTLEKFIIPRRPVSYDVMFNEGSYYMELETHATGAITGRYIPKSSLFSFEEEFKCSIVEG